MSKTLPALLLSLMIPSAALAQTAAPPASVSVEHAWARATPGRAETAAAYLTVVSAAADRLTGVSTPVAKKAGLHTMTMDGTIMRMRPLAALDLPAGQPVALQPGGTHIMLEGLNEPLRAGRSFPLTLNFEKAGRREVTVTIEKPGATGPAGHTGGGTPMPAPQGR